MTGQHGAHAKVVRSPLAPHYPRKPSVPDVGKCSILSAMLGEGENLHCHGAVAFLRDSVLWHEKNHGIGVHDRSPFQRTR